MGRCATGVSGWRVVRTTSDGQTQKLLLVKDDGVQFVTVAHALLLAVVVEGLFAVLVAAVWEAMQLSSAAPVGSSER